jgi:hypothetical protein
MALPISDRIKRDVFAQLGPTDPSNRHQVNGGIELGSLPLDAVRLLELFANVSALRPARPASRTRSTAETDELGSAATPAGDDRSRRR